MKKKHLIIAATVLLVVVVLLQLPKLASPDKLPQPYNFEEVKLGSIEKSVTATGTIEPITQVEVGTQVSGVISKLYVDYNSEVKKGQLLAEIDKTVLLSELSSRKAELYANKTEYEYQKKNYDRVAGLYAKNLVSPKEFETAEYQFQKAKAAYDKSEADMVKAKTNLSYASILSPIDGVILSRAVDEGQTVAASFNTPTLFTIANNLEKMQVIANVDEADIGDIKVGQKVSFTVDAFPDDTFDGNITQVRLEPTTVSNVVTYKVVVNAPNPELKLKPGLTANITITTAERNDVLVVSAKALKFKPLNSNENSKKESKQLVWIKKGSNVEAVPVKVGLTDGVKSEISGSIKSGDLVAISINDATTSKAKSTSNGASPFLPKPPSK